MLAHEFESGPICSAGSASSASPLRHKRLVRRLRHDLRLWLPGFVLAAAAALLAATVSLLERASAPAPRSLAMLASSGIAPGQRYFATISSSSTSNVSAAPGGIVGGAPRSP